MVLRNWSGRQIIVDLAVRRAVGRNMYAINIGTERRGHQRHDYRSRYAGDGADCDVHFILGGLPEGIRWANWREAAGGPQGSIWCCPIWRRICPALRLPMRRASSNIIDLALEFTEKHMKPSGALLVKCFNGTGYNEILMKFRQTFQDRASKKPKASGISLPRYFLFG